MNFLDALFQKIEDLIIDDLKQIPEDFDWKFYINHYPDLKRNGVKTEILAKRHWLRFGKSEGRIFKSNNNNGEITSQKESNQTNQQQSEIIIQQNTNNISLNNIDNQRITSKSIENPVSHPTNRIIDSKAPFLPEKNQAKTDTKTISLPQQSVQKNSFVHLSGHSFFYKPILESNISQFNDGVKINLNSENKVFLHTGGESWITSAPDQDKTIILNRNTTYKVKLDGCISIPTEIHIISYIDGIKYNAFISKTFSRGERLQHFFTTDNNDCVYRILIRTSGKGENTYTNLSISESKRQILDIADYFSPQISQSPKITVASIMDVFSHDCFAPEANLIPLHPNIWKDQIISSKPQFLLIESAWKGNNGQWSGKIHGEKPNEEIIELIEFCKSNEIPTVFWNKEDPPNFDKFINTAALFDYVFTTDINCVERYKKRLNHTRVAVLPFAAQPIIHNPIKNKQIFFENICFAGTYYAKKHKERNSDLDAILECSSEFGLHIFDRQFNFTSSDDYQYPEQFDNYIKGTLSYPQMLTAYRHYKAFINVNSVADSETMFSRRVFEIMACNTPVVSTKSIGIAKTFDSLVKLGNNANDYTMYFSELVNNEEYRLAYAHLGYRFIHNNHTYTNRFNEILSTIGINTQQDQTSSVAVIVILSSIIYLDNILNNFNKQSHQTKRLIIINKSAEDIKAIINEDVIIYEQTSLIGSQLNTITKNDDFDYFAIYNESHFYGEDYLSDLLLTFNYSGALISGKKTYYKYNSEKNEVAIDLNKTEYHTYSDFVNNNTLIFAKKVFDYISFSNETDYNLFTLIQEQACHSYLKIYASDVFNYLPIISIQDLDKIRDNNLIIKKITPTIENCKNSLFYKKKSIEHDLKQDASPSLIKWHIKEEKNKVSIVSKLNSINLQLNLGSDSRYLLCDDNTWINNLPQNKKNIIDPETAYIAEFTAHISGNVDASLWIFFYDESIKLDSIKSSSLLHAGTQTVHFKTPQNTKYYRIAIRLSGSGNFELRNCKLLKSIIAYETLVAETNAENLLEKAFSYKGNDVYFEYKDFSRYSQNLESYFSHIDTLQNKTPFVVMFSGTIYMQEERANRPIRLTKILLEQGIPVFFSYYRNSSTDPLPSNYHPLLFQSPIDYSIKAFDLMAKRDFGSRSRLFIVSFPYPNVCRHINIFNFNNWTTVYDARDDWEEFSKVDMAKWYNKNAEKFVLANCDESFTISAPLQQKLQSWVKHRLVQLTPNAYDTHFLKEKIISSKKENIRKIAGYFGHLTDKWFDWESLISVAKIKPDWIFELIGHQEPKNLSLPDNVILLGKKNHSEINKIASRWNVAIIIFKINDLSAAVDPIKIYEYLALELPTVSYTMPQIHNYPYTYIANTPESFAVQLEKAAQVEIISTEIWDFLNVNRWEDRVQFILELSESIQKRKNEIKSIKYI